MAFDEHLAERIRQRLARRKNVESKKMFGGIGFLLNGHLLVGIWKESLIVRLGAMGDIVHALPAVASLKHSFPGSVLTWVVEPRWAALLEDNPFVDRVGSFHYLLRG